VNSCGDRERNRSRGKLIPKSRFQLFIITSAVIQNFFYELLNIEVQFCKSNSTVCNFRPKTAYLAQKVGADSRTLSASMAKLQFISGMGGNFHRNTQKD